MNCTVHHGIEQALTEDEQWLVRLLGQYDDATHAYAGGLVDKSDWEAARTAILAHYRTAKKEEWAGGYQSCREDHGITEEDDNP